MVESADHVQRLKPLQPLHEDPPVSSAGFNWELASLHHGGVIAVAWEERGGCGQHGKVEVRVDIGLTPPACVESAACLFNHTLKV